MSLLEVEQQLQARTAKRQQQLAVLQVLAAMVETLHHSALLRKITQVRLLFCKDVWRRLPRLKMSCRRLLKESRIEMSPRIQPEKCSTATSALHVLLIIHLCDASNVIVCLLLVSSSLKQFFPVEALELEAALHVLNHAASAAAEIASLNSSQKGDVWLLI